MPIMLYLFFLLPAAFAQNTPESSTASLKGSVRDGQGKAVSGARIRLFRQDMNTFLQATADASGNFVFEQLVPGSTVLQIERDGFRSVTRSLDLAKGETRQVEVTLELAGVAQSVMVTASATPQSVDEIAKATSILTTEEIQARNEYSLAESLRTVPGVLITNGGGPGQFTQIRVRGLRPDATAVLVDGLRFRDASTTQADATSFVSALNLVGAERVEIVRGSGSSLYGTNAVGGVINVITQEGGSPLHGGLLFEGGALGFFRGRTTVGGGWKENRLRYSGSLLHVNVTRGVDGNDANRSTGGQGFLRYDLTPKMSLSGRVWASDDFVQLNISPTTAGIPAANFPATGVIPVSVLSPENVLRLNSGLAPDWRGVTLIPGRDDPDNRRSSRHATTAFIFRHMLNSRLNWQSSYQRVHTSRVFQNGPAGTGFQPAALNYGNYVGDIDTVDARFNAFLSAWLTLTAGYEFERERYFDHQNNNLPAPRTVVSQTRIRQDANTGYFAAQLALLQRRLQISLSGRGQFFELSRPSFRLTGTANNYDRVPLTSPPKALTGDAAISYLIPSSGTKLRLHWGNSYRAPSLYERFGGGFSSNPITGVVVFTPYGDPRLSPDRYHSVDAGLDQYAFQNRLRISATWFYTRVISVTAFDSSGFLRPETDPFGRSVGYINGSGGISRGVEFGAELRPTSSLAITGAYTYTNPILDRDITVQGFWRVFQVPSHLTSFVVTKRWIKRLDTNFELFRSSRYFNSYFAVNRSRAFEFPGFTKADFVASYRIWDQEVKSARLYFKLENLLNQRYYQNGWLAPRATFLAGLAFGF
ncbi:MAG: TonB-dependent receptor [Bryobacteraceae bacterium]|nr:TonB-dependent receptor [Bryobacteraceae bacterium]MDW8377654.1 TonB-dependent receptor [Bryobacterales bacterium]